MEENGFTRQCKNRKFWDRTLHKTGRAKDVLKDEMEGKRNCFTHVLNSVERQELINIIMIKII